MSGKNAVAVFANESGGHRWQEISGNKIHTSTITVAALPEPTEAQIRLNNADLEISACLGSGAGGQARQKTNNVIQIKHKLTGIIVRVESERSQHANKERALGFLRARLLEVQQNKLDADRAANRKNLLGQGQRADKRRTVAVQRDEVVDHILNKTWRYRDYSRGIID